MKVEPRNIGRRTHIKRVAGAAVRRWELFAERVAPRYDADGVERPGRAGGAAAPDEQKTGSAGIEARAASRFMAGARG
ncbi:MAG: hypothetical protein KJZ54_05345 [Phycisphaerales bacterium]|nr:hypothetical protein [Phycisphaerales bacterium]